MYFGARAIGASFHDRPLALTAATFELLDILYVRYNTAHPGARSDLLPFLRPGRAARVFNFKSTMFQVTPERLRGLGLSPAQCWPPAVPDSPLRAQPPRAGRHPRLAKHPVRG
jgi:hypothetical protein